MFRKSLHLPNFSIIPSFVERDKYILQTYKSDGTPDLPGVFIDKKDLLSLLIYIKEETKLELVKGE